MSRLTFLREFVRAPARLGSVTPSSRALADHVIDVSDVRTGHAVVELGAGTGPVTRRLLERYPDLSLLAFEPTAPLAEVLRKKFPGLEVRQQYADRTLPRIAAAWGHPRVDRVVSGLPWTMWPADVQDEVLAGITGALADDGRFVTYSYVSSQASLAGRRFRDRLECWFHRVERSPVLWKNLPPAVVLVGVGPRRR